MKVGPSRFPGGGLGARLHRRLRWHLGGYRYLAALLPERGDIVDLGAGWGLLAHALVRDGAPRRVLAVDHDGRRVRALAASAKDLPIDALEADLREVPVPPADGIALVDVLHYLDEEEQGELLVRCLRALRPGGTILLRDPDPSAFVRMAWTRLHEAIFTRLGITKGRVRAWRTGGAWVELLEAYGLRARALGLSSLSPYADRIVVGVRP